MRLCNSLFSNGLQRRPYQGLIVQAVFKQSDPKEDPYAGPNGETIVETTSILAFLQEVHSTLDAQQRAYQDAKERIDGVINTSEAIPRFATDVAFRKDVLNILRAAPDVYQVQSIGRFLQDALDPVWTRARETNGGAAWSHYKTFLEMLLDTFLAFDIKSLHPTITSFLADRFGDLCPYITVRDGVFEWATSTAATTHWRSRRNTLPRETIEELKSHARAFNRTRLETLLDNIPEASSNSHTQASGVGSGST
jgi:hypothetical protein